MKVVNGFRDFFNAVLSDEDEEDEEQPDVAPLPLQQQHRFGERLDISVSINNTNNSSGGEEALLTKQLQPDILGVVVVCDGGSNSDVQESVVNAVSTALGLPTNRISVNEMQPKTN